jgi:hypothetical protein
MELLQIRRIATLAHPGRIDHWQKVVVVMAVPMGVPVAVEQVFFV